MILWTVMPDDLVFGQTVQASPYDEIEYAGVKMQIEQVTNDQCRIVRILSTYPGDYLRQDVQPGQLLTAKMTYESLSGKIYS